MDVVDYSVKDHVAEIYLNRPQVLNAVIPQLVDEICQALDQASSDDAKVVVLGGRGRSFCAGHDLKHEEAQVGATERRSRLNRLQDITRKVRFGPYVVIAAVQGYALGAGCEFALCSDLVVATNDAMFGFPEVEVGLSVTGGISHILPIAVGLAKAKELVLLGRRLMATEAASIGLVNRVVEPDQLYIATNELAAELASRPRQSLLLAKSALDLGAASDLDASLDREVLVALALTDSEDSLRAAALFRARSAARSGQ